MLITVCFIIILKHTESKYIFRGVSFIKHNISKGYISVLTDRFSLIRKTSVGPHKLFSRTSNIDY